MNDWVACETCKTIFEYDPVRRIAQCPYCQKPEQTPAQREAKTRPAEREKGAGKTDRERTTTEVRPRP